MCQDRWGMVLRAVGMSCALLGVWPSNATAQATTDSTITDSDRTHSDSVRPKRTLDPVVVTASRRPQRASQAVIATTVITRDDIARSGATDVASVVLLQPGIQLGAGTPTGTNILIQGFGDQRVLILLDGHPLTGRVGGSFDLSRLPTSMVERIEIVEGPQSVLYGSDAMGGVVNIVTRPPGDGRNAVGAEMTAIAGSHGRFDATGRFTARPSGAVRLGLDGGRRYVRLTPGVTHDRGTYAERWDVAPSLTWRPNDVVRLEASGLGVSETQRYRSGQLYQFSDNTQLAGHVGLTWMHGVHRVSPTLSYSSYEHLSRAATVPNPVSDSGARDIQRLTTAEVAYSGLAARGVVDAGAEVRYESIDADRVQDRGRSTTWGGFFGQVTWERGKLALAPGARLAWSDDWGTTFTPRLALRVRPMGTDGPLTVRVSAAGGFRAPDFKERYLRFVNAAAGYAVNGNAALRPERSTNMSTDAEWVGDGFTARVSAFVNHFRDFIEAIGPDSTGTYTYGNVARGRTQGAEADVRRQWGIVTLSGGYAYLHTHNLTDGGPLLGRAAHRGNVTIECAPWSGATRGSLTANVTGRAPSARDENGIVTSERRAFTQVSMRVAQRVETRFTRGTELFAGIDNLFDTTLGAEWPGFTNRLFYAGFTWTR